MKRSIWTAAVLVSAMVVGFQGTSAVQAAPKEAAPTKEVALKADPTLKPKIDKRIAPFTWGMTPEQAMAQIDKQLDESFATKISGAYNPKTQAQLEKERDKQKKALRDKIIKFTGTGGVSGYEIKAPGEFTYKNNESALEVSRAGGGTRQLFFLSDRLWKVYDHVPLGKDTELGETWDSAVAKFEGTKDGVLGTKGKVVASKATSPAYFGTLIAVPLHLLWSDGTTQVRLIDHTHREDNPDKTVGIAYEETATVDKLPTYRTKIESKASDSAVDKAGFTPPPPKDDKIKPKK